MEIASAAKSLVQKIQTELQQTIDLAPAGTTAFSSAFGRSQGALLLSPPPPLASGAVSVSVRGSKEEADALLSPSMSPLVFPTYPSLSGDQCSPRNLALGPTMISATPSAESTPASPSTSPPAGHYHPHAHASTFSSSLSRSLSSGALHSHPAAAASSSNNPTTPAQSQVWSAASRQARLLRYIRFLRSLRMVGNFVSSGLKCEACGHEVSVHDEDPPAKSCPKCWAALSGVSEHNSTELGLALSDSTHSQAHAAPHPHYVHAAMAHFYKDIGALWLTLDSYLQTLSTVNDSGPSEHSRSSGPKSGQTQPGDGSKGKKESGIVKVNPYAVAAGSKSKVENSVEADGDTLEVMRLLPLVQCYFICNSPPLPPVFYHLPSASGSGSRSSARAQGRTQLLFPPWLSELRTSASAPAPAPAPAPGSLSSGSGSRSHSSSSAAGPSSSSTVAVAPASASETIIATLVSARSASASTAAASSSAVASSSAARNSVSADDFYRFTERHRRIVNIFCRKQPALLQHVEGGFVSLLWHPKKILDFDNKHLFFRSEIRRTRHAAARARRLGSCKLVVRRDKMFEDSYFQFQNLTTEDLQGKLTVKFVGEEGIDAGGVAREWFLVLSRAIFNPDYALFRSAAANNNVFQPNRFSWVNPDHLQYFKFVGRFVGKAIYDSQMLDAYFTRSFYKVECCGLHSCSCVDISTCPIVCA